MRHWMWTLAVIVTMSAAFTAVSARSEVKVADAQAPAESAKAKIGDPIVCAMDGMTMTLTAATPSTEYRGNTYYFCSKSEIPKFLEDPEKHIKH